MSETCTHLYSVSAWTRDPETGLWVHADPGCMKPSPLVRREPTKVRRRKLPNTSATR